MNFESFLEQQRKDYLEITPSYQKINKLFESEGEIISNDHIAYRTFNHPKTNIHKISQFFEKFGYEEKGKYTFKEKKVDAIHLEAEGKPKIFLSELRYKEIDENLFDSILETIEVGENIFEAKRPWKIQKSAYEKLSSKSEYASWLYIWGFRVNHFTVSVNNFKKYNSIEEVNTYLKANGFRLNNSGGEVKGSKEQYLVQSSILADAQTLQFDGGEFLSVPSCYYEFALRYPQENGLVYNGFVESSADKIFESTYGKR